MLCSDIVDGAQNGSGLSAVYDRLRGSESAAIENTDHGVKKFSRTAMVAQGARSAKLEFA